MEAVKTIGKIDSLILSDYILKNYGPMSHLKLQKLLFYCEAYHLAYFDEELTGDSFEAWVHGPVSRKVYDQLKSVSMLYADIKYNGDNTPNDLFDSQLISTQKEFISDVLNNLSSWKDIELEASTHNELPWIEARAGYSAGDKCDKEISKKTMSIFYKKEIGV